MICLPSRRTRIPAWPAPAANREPQAEAELLARKHHLKPPRSNPSHPVFSHRHDTAPPFRLSAVSRVLFAALTFVSRAAASDTPPSAPLRPFFAPQSAPLDQPAPAPAPPPSATHSRDAAACILLACDTTAAARLTNSPPRLSLFETACAIYLELSPPSSHPHTRSSSTSSTHRSRTTALCRRHRTDNGAVNAPATHSLRSVVTTAPVTLSATTRPHVRAPLPFALCFNVRHARCIAYPLF